MLEEQIFSLLKQILAEIQSLKEFSNNDEWLNASAFCRRFGISRPTLKKRVENGLIEKRNFDETTPRYRWKENAKIQ